MIAYIAQSTEGSNPAAGYVDPDRVFATGFSMGCMMSHRLALEKSKIVAGFGCHGGAMIQLGPDIAAEKKRFDVQPMPAYLTGGTLDGWFADRGDDLENWATMNGCTANATSEVNLTGTAPRAESPSAAVLSVRSQCTGSADAARLLVTGMQHVPDKRIASYTWDFLKAHTRSAAKEAMGPPPQSIAADGDTDGKGTGVGDGKNMNTTGATALTNATSSAAAVAPRNGAAVVVAVVVAVLGSGVVAV